MTGSQSDAALDHLARSALFGVLSDADRHHIITLMRPMVFAAGESIFLRGDKGNGVYLMLEGRVRLSVTTADGREISLNHATVGSVFGEIAALDREERSADATAISAAKVLVLPAAALLNVVAANPRVAQAAIQFLCARLRISAGKLETVALHSIEVRLARLLLSLIEERDPDLTTPSVLIPLDITQSEMGLLIGASRPKVNAALAFLESKAAFVRQEAMLRCRVDVLRRYAAL